MSAAVQKSIRHENHTQVRCIYGGHDDHLQPLEQLSFVRWLMTLRQYPKSFLHIKIKKTSD